MFDLDQFIADLRATLAECSTEIGDELVQVEHRCGLHRWLISGYERTRDQPPTYISRD